MTLRARLEEKIQREIISYIAAVAPRALVFACPNAAPRAFGGRASNGAAANDQQFTAAANGLTSRTGTRYNLV